MSDLSILILSYNTAQLTKDCVLSVVSSFNSFPNIRVQLIVLDNNSTDGSQEILKKLSTKSFPKHISFQFMCNSKNVGYAKGNNIALSKATGKNVLFLNSDVLVKNIHWKSIIDYMSTLEDIGGLTINVSLPNGSIDPASHRGFPTPWNAFCYYTKLEKLTSKIPIVNRICGGYHLMYKELSTVHTISSPSGAFFLMPTHIAKQLGGFDEDYFMYGEDIDLAYRIHSIGKKIYYIPHEKVIHLKYQSGIQHQSQKTNQKTQAHFYEAMKIFYKKHYEKIYPKWVTYIVLKGIDLKSSTT